MQSVKEVTEYFLQSLRRIGMQSSRQVRCKAVAKTGVFLLPVLILGGCAGEPTIQTGEDAETVLGTLNKVDNSRMDIAYVDPNGDYARYKRVYISPLDVDNVEIIQPSRGSSMLNRYNKEWELTDRDKQDLQTAFKDAAERQLTEGGPRGGTGPVMTCCALMR